MLTYLNITEMESLYNTKIKRDFPRQERRPLPRIKRLYKRECYTAITLQNETGLQAYATFINSEKTGNIFLDYFATQPQMRGQGVGSYFLALLKERWQKDGMILECETPESAKTEEQRRQRHRRIEFYQRAGAQTTRWLWHSFGVDYAILWLPLQQNQCNEAQVGKDLLTLYSLATPKLIQSMFTKLSDVKYSQPN